MGRARRGGRKGRPRARGGAGPPGGRRQQRRRSPTTTTRASAGRAEGPVAGLETCGEGMAFVGPPRDGGAAALESLGEARSACTTSGAGTNSWRSPKRSRRRPRTADVDADCRVQPSRCGSRSTSTAASRGGRRRRGHRPAGRPRGRRSPAADPGTRGPGAARRRRRPGRARRSDALEEIERITAETTPLVGSLAAELVRVACRAGDLGLAHRLVDSNPAMPGRSESIVVSGRAVIAEAEGRLEEAADGLPGRRCAVGGLRVSHGTGPRAHRRGAVPDRARSASEAADAAPRGSRAVRGPGATVLMAEVDDLLAQTTARAG